jgi:hypothetical protein
VASPTHGLTSGDGVRASDLEAELILEDDCRLLQREASEPLLAVWPEGDVAVPTSLGRVYLPPRRYTRRCCLTMGDGSDE